MFLDLFCQVGNVSEMKTILILLMFFLAGCEVTRDHVDTRPPKKKPPTTNSVSSVTK